MDKNKFFIKKIQQDATVYQNIYYSIFMWSSTCFGRHTAHHQEPKTALAASGFSYVEGHWTCSRWTLSGTVYCAWQHPMTFHVWKTRGSQCTFRPLMMHGVSPETCWASHKYGIIKILIHCCVLLDFLYELYYDAQIHKHHLKTNWSQKTWSRFLPFIRYYITEPF
jgi:hypothetical protein